GVEVANRTHVRVTPQSRNDGFRKCSTRPTSGRDMIRTSKSLIPGTRVRGKVLDLVLHAIPFLAVGRPFALYRDVRPCLGIFGIELEPLFQSRLGVGLDGFGRAFRLADAAIDAFVRMDDEHVVAFIETVDGTDLDA